MAVAVAAVQLVDPRRPVAQAIASSGICFLCLCLVIAESKVALRANIPRPSVPHISETEECR